jgi:signal transduction histidine kinase
VEVVALRTCQEALANARRHAGPAVPVALGLGYAEDALRVTVRDRGRGFDPAAPSAGYGLPGLRARAAELGGTATVTSTPGGGTDVTVALPLAGPRGERGERGERSERSERGEPGPEPATRSTT